MRSGLEPLVELALVFIATLQEGWIPVLRLRSLRLREITKPYLGLPGYWVGLLGLELRSVFLKPVS